MTTSICSKFEDRDDNCRIFLLNKHEGKFDVISVQLGEFLDAII